MTIREMARKHFQACLHMRAAEAGFAECYGEQDSEEECEQALIRWLEARIKLQRIEAIMVGHAYPLLKGRGSPKVEIVPSAHYVTTSPGCVVEGLRPEFGSQWEELPQASEEGTFVVSNAYRWVRARLVSK